MALTRVGIYSWESELGNEKMRDLRIILLLLPIIKFFILLELIN